MVARDADIVMRLLSAVEAAGSRYAEATIRTQWDRTAAREWISAERALAEYLSRAPTPA
jgi:hypothetical protein